MVTPRARHRARAAAARRTCGWRRGGGGPRTAAPTARRVVGSADGSDHVLGVSIWVFLTQVYELLFIAANIATEAYLHKSCISYNSKQELRRSSRLSLVLLVWVRSDWRLPCWLPCWCSFHRGSQGFGSGRGIGAYTFEFSRGLVALDDSRFEVFLLLNMSIEDGLAELIREVRFFCDRDKILGFFVPHP